MSFVLWSDAPEQDIKDATDEALTAKAKLDEVTAKYNKEALDRLSAKSVKALNDLYTNSSEDLKAELAKNTEMIEQLSKDREAILKKNVDDPLLKDVLPSETPETKAPEAPLDRPDFFTSITLEASSSYEMTSSSSQAIQTQLEARGTYAGATGSVGGAHTQASADAEKQLAKSNVKVSFECMRVDIDRPWLRPELFYDEDLCPAPGTR